MPSAYCKVSMTSCRPVPNPSQAVDVDMDSGLPLTETEDTGLTSAMFCLSPDGPLLRHLLSAARLARAQEVLPRTQALRAGRAAARALTRRAVAGPGCAPQRTGPCAGQGRQERRGPAPDLSGGLSCPPPPILKRHVCSAVGTRRCAASCHTQYRRRHARHPSAELGIGVE